MAPKIPHPFEWNSDFEVFYKDLDEQHQGLFKGIHDCQQSPGDAGLVHTLKDRVATHFRHEEAKMDKSGYKCEGHKDAHHGFEATLDKWSMPVSDGNISGAMKWLVEHICGTDFKYKGQLK
uniref:Hemerythrin n=2 Tax=Polychaeta TaxID=6341 RepID=A0A1S6QCQ7_9ANNE|nr:hemerythrin [Eunice pennata]AQV13704.1 hemerythrin [Nicomache venticola]